VAGEISCAAVGAVAADDDQTLDAHFLAGVDAFEHAGFLFEFRAACGKEQSAAALNDRRDRACIHLNDIAVEQAVIASANADDLHTFIESRSCDRTDCGIHARGVAAACQYTDSFHIVPPHYHAAGGAEAAAASSFLSQKHSIFILLLFRTRVKGETRFFSICRGASVRHVGRRGHGQRTAVVFRIYAWLRDRRGYVVPVYFSQ